MRVRIGLIVGTLVSISLSAFAEGDSLVDERGPREIAVGEAMRGGATGSTAIGLNPAGLPLNQELVFEGGYGYRGSDSASLVSASACDATNVLPGCFYYNYAGSNPELMGIDDHRATHVAGTTLAYPISPALSIGSSAKYIHHPTNVMGEDDSSGFTFDFGASTVSRARSPSVRRSTTRSAPSRRSSHTRPTTESTTGPPR